jgi:hypothetical protein
MTIAQMISELEELKDHTNDAGKVTLEGVCAALRKLDGTPSEAVKVPLTGDRRSEERDARERDQLQAQRLNLTDVSG